jgi:hypothetical protein
VNELPIHQLWSFQLVPLFALFARPMIPALSSCGITWIRRQESVRYFTERILGGPWNGFKRVTIDSELAVPYLDSSYKVGFSGNVEMLYIFCERISAARPSSQHLPPQIYRASLPFAISKLYFSRMINPFTCENTRGSYWSGTRWVEAALCRRGAMLLPPSEGG